MTMTAVRDVAEVTRITRDSDARPIALAVYGQLLDLLDRLSEDDWRRVVPDCPAWTVADCVGHMVGAAHGHASLLQLARQMAWARRHRDEFDGNEIDALSALQVRDHADDTPAERVAALRRLAPRAVAGRMRTPGVVRARTIPVAQSGSLGPGAPPSLRLGHLMDAVLTRDVWMHRLDIARATERPLVLDQDADRRVVEDVVAEWAERHGQPFRLTLTGPAGGLFRSGSGGADLEHDAATFCRLVSGRGTGEGLLATHVLF